MKVFRLLFFAIYGLFAISSQAADLKPIRVDASKLYPGLLLKIRVNDLPVFILDRRFEEIAALTQIHAGSEEAVIQCPACDPVLRSIAPEYLVVWGYNPASGCELIYAASTATDWVGYAVNGRGGFIDKCAAAEYDLSGRQISGPESSPRALAVPPYSYKKGVITFDTQSAK